MRKNVDTDYNTSVLNQFIFKTDCWQARRHRGQSFSVKVTSVVDLSINLTGQPPRPSSPRPNIQAQHSRSDNPFARWLQFMSAVRWQQ